MELEFSGRPWRFTHGGPSFFFERETETAAPSPLMVLVVAVSDDGLLISVETAAERDEEVNFTPGEDDRVCPSFAASASSDLI